MRVSSLTAPTEENQQKSSSLPKKKLKGTSETESDASPSGRGADMYEFVPLPFLPIPIPSFLPFMFIDGLGRGGEGNSG